MPSSQSEDSVISRSVFDFPSHIEQYPAETGFPAGFHQRQECLPLLPNSP